MKIITSPSPPPRKREARLTDAIRNLKPGQSIIADRATARCAIAHYRYRGIKTVQRELPDRQLQIWILP